MKDYKFTDDMTPVQFQKWYDNLTNKDKSFYDVYLYTAFDKHLCLEFTRLNNSWEDLTDENDIRYKYCRIKPEPKPKEYKPYEKADVEWIGKLVKYKNHSTVRLISAVDIVTNAIESVEVSSCFNSLRYMFEYYEWFDIETGETRPFGEEK